MADKEQVPFKPYRTFSPVSPGYSGIEYTDLIKPTIVDEAVINDISQNLTTITSPLGVGTVSQTAQLESFSTTKNQLQLSYNTSNSTTLTTDSAGAVTIDPSGDSVKIPYLTLGSVLFASTGGKIEQDNANLFWDNTNNRLGIGCTDPFRSLEIRHASLPQLILASAVDNAVIMQGSGSGLVVDGYRSTGSGAVNFFSFRGDCTNETMELQLNNTKSSGASGAKIVTQVHTTSTGDAFFQCYNGTTYWSLGLDNSDSDSFKLSNGNTPGTTDIVTVTTGGLVFGNISNALTSPHLELIQGSTGDSALRFTESASHSYIIGIDNSDSDKWKLSYGSAGNAVLGTNDLITVTTAGAVSFASLTLSGMTEGSVLFAGTAGALSQNNASFFWDNANKQLDIYGTTAAQLKFGDSANMSVTHRFYDAADAFDSTYIIDPASAITHDGAFCSWKMSGSDFTFSYTSQGAKGQGVPNVTISGPPNTGTYTSASGPGLNLQNELETADNKTWSMYLAAKVLTCNIINDANNVATTWLAVTRSGTTVSGVSFPSGPVTVTNALTASYLNLGSATAANSAGEIAWNAQSLPGDGSAPLPTYSFGNLATTGIYCISASGGDLCYSIAGTTYFRMLANEFRMSSGVTVSWATGDPTATAGDLGLSRIGAQVLGLKSGTSTQELRIYGNGTNYLIAKHDGTDATVGPNSGDLILAPTGTGVVRPPTDDAYVLGSTAKRWNAVIVSGRVDVGGSSPDHSVAAAGVVFNEQQADIDFRIEGDSISHLFFTDATATTENIAILAAAAPNWQSGDKILFVGDRETAPTGNPASGFFHYSASGQPTWRDDGGVVFSLTQATGGENVTNNVTDTASTNGTIPDFTNGAVYATDYTNIRNAIFQLARMLKQDHDQLRAMGILT